MQEMTAGNLRSAYGGESMACLRYQVWGEKARLESYANVARLFRAISFAEQVHGANHFKVMRGGGPVDDRFRADRHSATKSGGRRGRPGIEGRDNHGRTVAGVQV